MKKTDKPIDKFKVFDIEAYDWNEIYAIGLYDGNEPIVHYTTERSKNRVKTNNEFIDWLFSYLANGDVVYAHNGGKYDFLFILDYASAGNAKLIKLLTINGSVVQMDIKKDNKKIIFRDSYHILPASLLRLTNDFDVEHKKLKMDYELGVKDERFKEYFNNDLLGLYEVLKMSGLTEKVTVASNAMSRFNMMYKKKMERNSDKIDEFFRGAYVGGRVEVFKHRGSALYDYDVNSLYPYVMSKNKYPLPIKNNYIEVNYFINGQLGIYECDVEAPDMYIPILPIRYEGKLIFPIGKFSGVFCSPELELAIEQGYKIKVKRGYIFPKTDYIFKEYVEHYYEIKKNSAGAKRAVAKLMLNSLYGKFGQKRNHSELVPVVIKDNELPKMAIVYGSLLFEPKATYDSFSKFLHSEIAAFVTSYARVHLYRLMQKVGLENVYYCDTDSVFTSKAIPTSDELGDVKNEATIFDFIAIAPKLYAYISEDRKVVIKAKGLRITQLNYKAFEQAAEGDFSGLQSEVTKISSIKEGMKHGQGIFTNLITLRRGVRSADSKRITLKSGDTKPVKLEII